MLDLVEGLILWVHAKKKKEAFSFFAQIVMDARRERRTQGARNKNYGERGTLDVSSQPID